DDAHQPVLGRDEIGGEDGDELAFGDLEACIQGSGLEAVAVGAVNVDDVVTERGVTLDDGGGDIARLVGGVVEHLNLDLLARVLHGADGLDETVDDKLLVEDGQLDGDGGKLEKMAWRIGFVVLAELEVVVAHGIAVNSVDGEKDHHHEIRNQHAGIEEVPVVEPPEGLVGVLHLEVVAETTLRSQGQEEGSEFL